MLHSPAATISLHHLFLQIFHFPYALFTCPKAYNPHRRTTLQPSLPSTERSQRQRGRASASSPHSADPRAAVCLIIPRCSSASRPPASNPRPRQKGSVSHQAPRSLLTPREEPGGCNPGFPQPRRSRGGLGCVWGGCLLLSRARYLRHSPCK